MLIEDYYAKYLEGPYNRIYDLLTDETVDFISDDDRNLIISIIITMYFRTTKWISEHNKFMNDVLEKVFSMAEHLKKDYFLDGDTKIAIKGKTVDQISKEYQAKDKEHQTLTQLSVALKLIKTRSLTDQISVCKLMEDSCEFITSDHPVICTNNAASHVIPVDPNNIFGIPLDKKHKLYISPIDKVSDKNKIERYQLSGSLCTSNSYMSNKHQAYNADRFILGEQSSLSRFISIRNLLEQPLSPDEDLKDLEVKYTHLMNLLK